MAEVTVHAIVLRRRDSGESDRRLTLLTRELGKIDAVAKGARKPASRLAATSDPLSVAVFQLATGKKNRFITQAQPLSSFRGLRTDYERLSFALALVELYAALVPWEQPDSDEVDLLEQSLKALERHERPLVALAWSEVRLLVLAGFMPQLETCVVTGKQIAEAQPLLSPHAGGYVSERSAIEFTDCYRVRAEVLYGLARLSHLEEPPGNLKFADESIMALLPFLRSVADTPLPANEAVTNELRS